MSQISRSVTEFFKQYLRRRMTAQAEGLGLADPDGMVMPHEAAPVQPVDPRLAWEDALAVVRWSGTGETSIPTSDWEVPPDWPGLVAAQEPAVALAFCLGNFPQLVRDLQPLLLGGNLSALHQSSSQPAIIPPALLQWANTVHGYPQLLVACGLLRLARRFEEASKLLKSNGKAPAEYKTLRANEEAALAWHRGHGEEALALWQTQKPSVPVLFNRGMASLFLGRTAEARTGLEQAVVQLPETSSWHHLAHLYLALASRS